MSCGDSIEGCEADEECPKCGKDITESLRILESYRSSPEYAHMLRAGFGWRSIILSTFLRPDRVDFRKASPYSWVFVAGVVLQIVAVNKDWLSPAVFCLVLNPGWFLATFLAFRLGPVRRFHRRVAEEDFCMFCEYSFRGHGEDGVCPECGKDIADSLRILKWHREEKPPWMKLFI